MKSITLASVAAGLLGMVSVSNAYVERCPELAYANGGIYSRVDEHGVLVPDLGNFPITGDSWELATKRKHQRKTRDKPGIRREREEADTTHPLQVEWGTDGNLYLLRSAGNSIYIRYRDHAYLDTNPGAVEPLRFTPDNSTLGPGEASWAWSNLVGFPFFLPDGNHQATPGRIPPQGFEFLDVPGYRGVKQIYWNQTHYDAGLPGKWWPTMCLPDRSAVLVRVDRP
ncbi:hypothetical protein ACRALDRAFT_1067516 [Sodiomyces alcalophilus JCM 7366]|uniref:uncharacterized protein n=1 Tax=Sodiomyces alcalophilus JCM 7366 TaxID=591952 RepID=UPI0039B59FCC